MNCFSVWLLFIFVVIQCSRLFKFFFIVTLLYITLFILIITFLFLLFVHCLLVLILGILGFVKVSFICIKSMLSFYWFIYSETINVEVTDLYMCMLVLHMYVDAFSLWIVIILCFSVMSKTLYNHGNGIQFETVGWFVKNVKREVCILCVCLVTCVFVNYRDVYNRYVNSYFLSLWNL